MDKGRRNLLGGGLIATAALGLAKAASAQTSAAQTSIGRPPELPASQPPQTDPTAEALQSAIRTYNDPKTLKVTPVGQDWANLRRYRPANIAAKAFPAEARKVVMMGDSITDNWPGLSGDVFAANGWVGRGIGGQTTAQMVVRFWAEVVELKPKVVHILAGTNDVAENLDPYDFAQTARNIMSMAVMASANRIRVVIGSVPPADSFAWRPERGNPVELIKVLNVWIAGHCREKGYEYADYWPVLASPDGSLKPEFGLDSVHPNAAGYAAMAPVALAAISRARS